MLAENTGRIGRIGTKPARDGLKAQKSEKARRAYREQHESDFLIADAAARYFREHGTVSYTHLCPIARQVMVTVLIRQRFAHCQQCYDLLQQLNLQATLYGSFVVFFETYEYCSKSISDNGKWI